METELEDMLRESERKLSDVQQKQELLLAEIARLEKDADVGRVRVLDRQLDLHKDTIGDISRILKESPSNTEACAMIEMAIADLERDLQ